MDSLLEILGGVSDVSNLSSGHLVKMKHSKAEQTDGHVVPPGVEYRISQCCQPGRGDEIVAYMREDKIFSVHRRRCPNLRHIAGHRLVDLTWDQVDHEQKEKHLDGVYWSLDDLDFRILAHLATLGLDFAHPISRHTGIPLAETFSRLRRLKSLQVIERVQKVMIHYRKGIVDGTWIKHRNHTYYELTRLGREMVSHRAKVGPHV